jgi:glycosyltransferase involved in cell wall biosynthesis
LSLDFSIVIPTFNRAEQLRLTLMAFNFQSYPFDQFEVIIVDDGSTDHTKSIIENFNPLFSLNYYFSPKNNRWSIARNIGISLAKGKYIVFCDADFLVVPNFLSLLKEYHSKYKRTIVSGVPNCWTRIFTHYYPELSIDQKKEMFETLTPIGSWKDSFWGEEQSFVPIIDHREFQLSFDYAEKYVSPLKLGKRSQEQYQSTDVAPWLLFVTRCVSVKKKYLDQVGWFDESFIKFGLEDWELGYRLHLKNFKFVSVKEMLGYHQVHPKHQGSSGSENLIRMFHKFGFSDPELNLFATQPPWKNVRIYKESLRKVKAYQNQGMLNEASRLLKKWENDAKVFYKRKKKDIF